MYTARVYIKTPIIYYIYTHTCITNGNMHSTYMKPHIKLKRVNIIISHISSLAIYSYMYMIHIQGASCTFSNGMGH